MFRFFKRSPAEVSAAAPVDVFDWLHDLNGISAKAVLFDVGAHLGETSRRMLSVFPDARVFAFEPFEDSFRQLAASFGDDPRVDCVPFGMNSQEGSGQLFVNASLQTNSLLKAQPVNEEIDPLTTSKDKVPVTLTTIDAFMQQRKIAAIDLLKIDVQGLTYEVLLGAATSLKEKRVKWVYAEVEFVEIYAGEKRFAEVELLMRNAGYRFVRFFNLNHIRDGSLAWADALFTAEDICQ
jgi:FkbM family methyltransferase